MGRGDKMLKNGVYTMSIIICPKIAEISQVQNLLVFSHFGGKCVVVRGR